MQGRYVIKDTNFAHLNKDHCYVKLKKINSKTKRITLITLVDISQATSFESESEARTFMINELIIGQDHLILPKDKAKYEIIQLY